VRVNPRRRTIKSLFKTFLDVVHVRLGQDARLGLDKSTRPAGGDRVPGVGGGVGEEEQEEEQEGQIVRKAEMEQKVKELGQRPDIYAILSRSLAPSVWAMDDVKKGILLQLFGGTNKSIARGGGGGGPRYRGDINVLLVGDPGTSKSQILQVSKVSVTPSFCLSVPPLVVHAANAKLTPFHVHSMYTNLHREAFTLPERDPLPLV
jgi:DNA replication licensing factor MCM4